MRNPPLCKRCGQHRVIEKITNNVFKGYLRTCANCFGYHHIPGPNHPNATKKGRRQNEDGYIQLLDPRKRGAKRGSHYILEHRWIMEQHLGRALTRKEVVHHRNGIRHDNRLKNLLLLPPGAFHESRTLIKALQAHIRKLEKQLLRKIS